MVFSTIRPENLPAVYSLTAYSRSFRILLAVLLSAGLGAVATAAPVTAVATESFLGGRYQSYSGAWPGSFWWDKTVTSTAAGEAGPVQWQYGNGTAGYDYEYSIRFALSDLGYGSGSITSVNLKVTELAHNDVNFGVGVFYSTTTANANAYPANTDGPVHPAYYIYGSGGTTFHLVDGYVITPSNAPYSLSLDVTSVIKQAYADGLTSVWFTLYSESRAGNVGQNNWQSTWGTPYNSTAAYQPTLTIVPEPAALSLLALGALAGLGRRRR